MPSIALDQEPKGWLPHSASAFCPQYKLFVDILSADQEMTNREAGCIWLQVMLAAGCRFVGCRLLVVGLTPPFVSHVPVARCHQQHRCSAWLQGVGSLDHGGVAAPWVPAACVTHMNSIRHRQQTENLNQWSNLPRPPGFGLWRT